MKLRIELQAHSRKSAWRTLKSVLQRVHPLHAVISAVVAYGDGRELGLLRGGQHGVTSLLKLEADVLAGRERIIKQVETVAEAHRSGIDAADAEQQLEVLSEAQQRLEAAT